MASLSAQIILCIALISATCLIIGVNGSAVERQREFDYFALALQWPGTICHQTRHCCSSNGCCRGSDSPTEFTIHGLWPDYNDGSWPSCCARSQFDIKEISTLMGALQKYWPSLYCSRPSTCFSGKGIFWAHEKMLNEAGYVPSNSERYPLGGLVSAIENSFQATPEVICSKHDVKEIRLCFYKDFKPRNCLASKTSCPKYVSLPTYVALWRNETEMGIERISGDFEAL
ncbi:hypothetical protein E1A91_D11G161700v1 [Gossypium mustelinum]|uniref:Uncharacterized protein n=4 Tax=Gossypium TaxID=3633 RepID=A0A5D2STM9_GOSMU|nr:hypothetical protein E1A91_D11G161700v1 [Gossypium mustelinum]